jgi:peptide/nickel transport system permease protein
MSEKGKNSIDTKEELNTTLPEEGIGLVGRFIRGRIWYGAEWYFAVAGATVLIAILLMTLFAPVLAPYDPNGFVAAPFIPPGGGHQLLIVRDSDANNVNIDSLDQQVFGVIRNKNGDKVARELTDSITRYGDLDSLALALAAGEVDFAFVDELDESMIPLSVNNLTIVERGMGTSFPLGTDNLGRDMVSRVIWGARTVMSVALLSALFSSTVGITLGLISGFMSGLVDRVLSLTMDSLYSFPGLLLAIAMVAMLGPGMINVAVAVSVIYIPTFFRVVRGQVLTIKEELYVDAARSLGAKSSSILLEYILPNVIPSIVVVFSINIADAILTEAGLSFIGLGLPPDIPDWGYDLSKGHSFLVAGHWWLITVPGVLITLVSLSFSMLGESLSEILNPRLSDQ